MLSVQENERVTRVGPGTPCGEMLRRYWHPIHPAEKLDENPVAKVRILGENLVLFRDRSGALGLIEERCPHRQMTFANGIPEKEGLRCCYHGWLFDNKGHCLETPLEPPDSNLAKNVKIIAYPVQEMGGLIWAYLGALPAPQLPRWDLFIRPGGLRQIITHTLPCNWLQVMENRADLAHDAYTHGRLFQYALERKGRLTADERARYNASMIAVDEMRQRGAYVEYRAIENPFGMTKGLKDSDQSPNRASWKYGINPILFPYMVADGGGVAPPGDEGLEDSLNFTNQIRRWYQIGVPIDDTTTWHIQYFFYDFPPEVGIPYQSAVPHVEVPLTGADGEYTLDYVLAQDMVAWHGQGSIVDRSKEHLGKTDSVVIAYRRMLRTQIDRVEKGEDPINVFRDGASVDSLERTIPGNEEVVRKNEPSRSVSAFRDRYHEVSPAGWLYIEDDVDRYCPDREIILSLFRKTQDLRSTTMQ